MRLLKWLLRLFRPRTRYLRVNEKPSNWPKLSDDRDVTKTHNRIVSRK